jgi:hypothetical protein
MLLLASFRVFPNEQTINCNRSARGFTGLRNLRPVGAGHFRKKLRHAALGGTGKEAP